MSRSLALLLSSPMSTPVADRTPDREQSCEEKVVTEARVDWWLKAQFCIIGCVSLLGWNFILGELGTLIDAFGASYGTWVSMFYSLLYYWC
ncbi:solute carrier 29 (nucleoside transporters), member [Perkinsus olseni]|uniref:Solute carrier 29 (Nucleoside transporters), member n=1 Tax=Perkinsus olseni TaxID=32597 RepID=A0A7J6PRD0_PEROL|nr:solute carrier 29 (nucleoside transporters), member [Perkinsus olseni]